MRSAPHRLCAPLSVARPLLLGYGAHMGSFQIDIDIQRPAEEVFAYLADVTNTPHWYSAVQTARQISGDGPTLGAAYALVRHLPQGRVEDLVTIDELDPPHLVRIGTSEGATPFSYRYRLELRGVTTRVHLDGEIEVTGPARLLGPVATQAFKRGIEDNLQALRGILESA